MPLQCDLVMSAVKVYTNLLRAIDYISYKMHDTFVHYKRNAACNVLRHLDIFGV
jgi:hypothetical protein